MSTVLEVEDLRVHYDGIEALRGISFGVRSGELISLIGANGAGKTTLLRSLSGLLRGVTGRATFDGKPLLGRPAEGIARSGLVHVPEGRHVFPGMTVRDNLLVAAWGRRHGVAEGVEEVEALFPRLAERRDQMAGTLSGGEQQMLAIGRALMRQPRVLMLDEPSMGLAPQMVRTVFDLIRRIHGMGTTVLLVEQNARLALEIATRAYVLERGTIVADGDPQELAASDEVRRAYLGGV
jgi:branched-chain amino acid transport system ATP-binding protein